MFQWSSNKYFCRISPFERNIPYFRVSKRALTALPDVPPKPGLFAGKDFIYLTVRKKEHGKVSGAQLGTAGISG